MEPPWTRIASVTVTNLRRTYLARKVSGEGPWPCPECKGAIPSVHVARGALHRRGGRNGGPGFIAPDGMASWPATDVTPSVTVTARALMGSAKVARKTLLHLALRLFDTAKFKLRF